MLFKIRKNLSTQVNIHKRFVYLSVMMDACTKEVMGYVVSSNLKENFVLETVKQVLVKHKVSLSSICLVHSDQGVHYTSGEFRQLLKVVKVKVSPCTGN